VKDMRTIAMNQHTVLVVFIAGIAAYMRLFINQPDRLAGASQLFGDNATGKSGAYHQKIVFH
jgi:hypothetical protein